MVLGLGLVLTILGGLAAEPSLVSLRIGLVLPPGEPEARSIQQGAAVGALLANLDRDVTVELISQGSPGQWGTEGDDAVTLALDVGAQALIAPTLGTTVHLVEQVAGRTRVPVVSLCGDTSVTGARIPWVLRIVPTTVDEARVLFARARTPAGGPVKRWSAIVPADRAGREAMKDLGLAAKEGGCDIVNVVAVAASTPDPAALVAQAVRGNPQGLLIWLEPTLAGRLARVARESGYPGALAGPGRLCGPTFLEVAGPAAEGVWTMRPVLPPASVTRREKFVRAWGEQYAAGPDPAAAAAADAVVLLVSVVREAGSRPAFTLMPPKGDRPGITGVLKFDGTGNRLVELEAVVARDGKFGPVTLPPEP